MIANLVAPDLFNESYGTPEKDSFSCGVLDMAKIICVISKGVTKKYCALTLRDEIQEFDKPEVFETIERMPDRFTSEVEHLIEYYMVQ